MKPYWSDETVTLYHGDMREVLPALGLQADCIVTDPPYGETSLTWDRWPAGWPALAATVASSMWCFGSMRMFLAQRQDFDGWKLSQDIVWEKQSGSGFASDRFRRVHEVVTHWYRGDWKTTHHETPKIKAYDASDKYERRNVTADLEHTGKIGPHNHQRDGMRLTRSVIKIRNMHGRALHPTEKPIGILDPLIRYACPPGGLVVDLFAGSGSTLDAARQSGRRAIGIEASEAYCEAAARRLSNLTLEAM